MTRSHKYTDRDHAGIADGTAEREARLPKYFGKSGHADTDPTKTKKGGSGKGNWGAVGDEVEDIRPNMANARRRSNSSTHNLKDFKTKLKHLVVILSLFFLAFSCVSGHVTRNPAFLSPYAPSLNATRVNLDLTKNPFDIKNPLSPFESHNDVLARYLGSLDSTKLREFFTEKLQELYKDNPLGLDCTGCKNLISSTTLLLKKIWEKEFFKYLLKYCEKTQPSLECQDVINIYGGIIYDSIYNHYINADFTCGIVLLLCPATESPMNITQYIQRVLKDKPDTPLPTPTKKSTFKVLQITDIHIDPYYKENAIVNCGQSLCCREQVNSTSDYNGPLSGYWGTLAGCDLPFRTVEQMANFIAKNVQVDFVLWTGDNSQHDINKTSDENINNTLSLSTLFHTALNNVPFYPALGNHETFPLEVWNFKANPDVYSDPTEKTYQQDQEKFESTFSNDWKVWIGPDGSSLFEKNGYYSTYNQKLGVRIISMNTNACHTENFYLLLDPTDPGDMLAWFEATLRQSEKDNESVYVIGHIAPSSADCFTQWSTRFSALIERFSHVIRGQFYGHIHSDSFLIYKSLVNTTQTVQSGFIAPSMTTNSHRNPSFRVFEIDSDTKIPVNYYQYRLNLTKANEDPSQPLHWDIAYDFLSEYGYSDLSLATMDNFRSKILNDKPTFQKVIDNYNTGAGGGGSNTGFYCGLLSTYDQNVNCLKQLNITVTPSIMNEGLSIISGVWINKTITE